MPQRYTFFSTFQKRLGSIPVPLLFVLAFAAVALSHLTLLHLPYFWDEGGYYVPAALDFFHTGTLIPQFTNAHPPLPSVILGSLWHVFGFHILVTRLTACAFAAAGITAVYALGQRLLSPLSGLVLALLTAIYPIWFAQSSLAHADIFAAAFTLAALCLYFTSPHLIGTASENFSAAPQDTRISAEALHQRSVAARKASHHDGIASTEARSAEWSAGVPRKLAGWGGRDLRISQRDTERGPVPASTTQRLALATLLFCLAALAKETSIVQPAALAAFELFLALRAHNKTSRRTYTRWAIALAIPIPVVAAWFAYHFLKTGLIFGNPVYLRYNATDNFTLAHVLYALRIRFVHLFWQREIWLPLVLAIACLFLPRRLPAYGDRHLLGLPRPVVVAIAVLVVANLLAFSVLGGALLTRYLLPVYPLLLLTAIATWREHLAQWPLFAALTAAAFIAAIWLNPSTFFAPEDNLTYRNMIVVQQDAIDFLNAHFPNATVLTAWPVSADLFRPELGYTQQTFRVYSLENFTQPELTKAAQNPGQYDTALVFTTHYTSPAFHRFLVTHPNSWRTRRYAEDIDLTPAQIAQQLGGQVVWQEDRYGEWAAILRFARSYTAHLTPPQ